MRRHSIIAVAILGAAMVGPRGVTVEARQATWSLSGLAGQTITALVIDPLTPTTVYAGVLGGGVFKTTDGGSAWSPINNGLTTSQIRAVAIDAQTPTTLYAGSGGAGLFKTTDAGASWTLLDNARMNANFIFDIAVDPQTPSTLYVGGNGENLLKSVDGGTTWISAGPVSSQAIAIDPLTPTTLYAGTDIAVHKSVDGGANWTETPAQPFSIFDITIDPGTPSTVYASARPFITTGGVLKSTDGGASWAPVTIGVGEMARAVAIDPQSPSTLYAALLPSGAADAAAFKSTDGGASWTAMNDGLESVGVRSFAVDAVNQRIYAGTTSGVFVAVNNLPSDMLVVRKKGGGDGTIASSPAGIDCGFDCSEPFARDTVVTLTATPNAESRFAGWTGCDSASGTSCVVTMAARGSVSAKFLPARADFARGRGRGPAGGVR
jgi:photosystem II stability/assembly factor-like uncharacterized protein